MVRMMAKNKLTDHKIKSLKAQPKTYKKFDGDGLYIEVLPSGTKSWRIKYRYKGEDKRMSFGQYPYLALAEARRRRDEIKTALAQGLDPAEVKIVKTERTFRSITEKWYATKEGSWADRHKNRIWARFQNDLFPALGARPVKEITAPELLCSADN